jgi:predicted translin family RNA/ssDNA-binding protein
MTQLPKQYLDVIKTHTLAYQEIRRIVIKESGDALHHAKKSIFAVQRGDMSLALLERTHAETILVGLVTSYKKTPEFQLEGAFRAAIEEYVEATIFFQCVTNAPIKKITSVPIPDEVFIAGLADVPGELYRYALNKGTQHDIDEVLRVKVIAEDIVESLIEFDLTKQLRNKFDQAKSALHKIEQVAYELSV